MTYQKLQVSNGLDVIPSDTVNIPNPDTEILSSNNGAFGVGGALLDSNLEGPDGENVAQAGDIIYNITNNIAYYVTRIGASQLLFRTPTASLPGTSDYVIYREATRGCILFSGVAGNISTQLEDKKIFKGISAGSFLPTQVVRVNETNTTATDIIALW